MACIFDNDCKESTGNDISIIVRYDNYNYRTPEIIGTVGISSGFVDIDLFSVDGYYTGLYFDYEGFIIEKSLKNYDMLEFNLNKDNVFNNSFSDYIINDGYNYSNYLAY
jgi:hypothetical protein